MKRYLPLRPPDFDNIEQNYQADLVYIFAWAAIFVVTFFKSIKIIIMPEYGLREITIIGLVDSAAIISLLLNRQKLIHTASAVLPFALWLITTYMALTSGGVFAPAVAAYLPVIIMCGLLLGKRSGIMMAILCITSTLVFAVLSVRGELPVSQIIFTPVTAWISFLMWGLQITIIQYVVTVYIHSSFSIISKETEERKRAEMMLRESEFNYRMVVKNKIFGVAWLSPDGMILNASDTLIDIIGYTPGELKGMYFGDVTYPDDLPRELELLEKIKNKETDSYLIEKRLKHKNGEYFWVQLNRTAYYNEQTNDIEFYITIIQDIQQRKLAEEALKESEFNYRMVVQNRTMGIAWASPDGKVLQASGTFCEMLGYTEEELKGVHFSDFTHPEEVSLENLLLEQIQKGEIDSYTIEKRYKHKSGEYFWVELNLTAYRNAVTNVIEYYVGLVQNIQLRKVAEEALKQSEEKYRYLFNNNPALIVIWDPVDFSILEANETALHEYGYTRDEIMKMTTLDLRPPEEYEKTKAFAVRLINGSENKMTGIWKHKRKNGEQMDMDITSHRIVYKNRLAVLAICVDVTEKVRIEAQLKRSYEDIRLLNAHMETVREEERASIAREIHDELGQQLTGLKMDASWLAKRADPQDTAVQEKFADVFSLIDDTIKTIRKISSDLRPGLLDDLGLQAALEWLSNDFEKRTGISCRLHIKLSDHYFSKDVCTAVFRIYQEALTNITRHAGATEVDTTFEVNEDQVAFTVKDNGIGFDVEGVDNINTFGLLGMEERAHMLNGELKVESEKNKGTTVILKFPLTNATDKTLV